MLNILKKILQNSSVFTYMYDVIASLEIFTNFFFNLQHHLLSLRRGKMPGFFFLHQVNASLRLDGTCKAMSDISEKKHLEKPRIVLRMF